MGTQGNKPGYKVFSFSTTVRNPKRNIEFLEVLNSFDDMDLTKDIKNEIYTKIIKNGTYKFNKLDSTIKKKYESKIDLNDEEVKKIISNNPQKTGNPGRLMTQVRAIKDCGFITLSGPQNKKHMKITPLGRRLLEGYDVENIYTKAMIGLHANNPQRNTIYNKSRPFLNTLNVISEINKHYKNNKGVLWHEFAFFILSMKDCDYKKAAKQIIEYRNKFAKKVNKTYLENYIYNELKLNHVDFNTIKIDYTDDVYRKFDMTGLVTKSGFRDNTYLRFNEYNIKKVIAIINANKNYKFKEFTTLDEYINFISNISLPWEKSDKIKKEIIQSQIETLQTKIDNTKSLDEQMKELNEIYTKKLFDSTIDKFSINLLKEELLILDGTLNKKSAYDSVPEPVRLEWLIAVLTAKIYGAKYVKPNLSLDSSGIPKSHASGGMADIEFITENLYCLLEVTLMKDYRQQNNSETTSISDHLDTLKTNKKKCSLLIAPYIHKRVVDYFQYCLDRTNLSIIALTIQKYIDITLQNQNLTSFENVINELTRNLKQMTKDEYTDMVNNFKIEKSCL